MAVDHVDRDDNGRASAELDTFERDGSDRSTHQDRRRRIEPNRLLEHGIELRELGDLVAANPAIACHAKHFLTHAFLPFGKKRKQVEAPSQGL